jgi:hypothetical protein
MVVTSYHSLSIRRASDYIADVPLIISTPTGPDAISRGGADFSARHEAFTVSVECAGLAIACEERSRGRTTSTDFALGTASTTAEAHAALTHAQWVA